MINNETINTIIELAKPYLLEGKPEDLMHSLSVLESAKLIAESPEQLDLLVPFAILHDTGNSILLKEDLHYMQGKTIVENGKLFHGLAGAKIAHKILTQINYGEDLTKEIVDLIKIHDLDDYELFKKRSWQIAKDIDYLDRMNVERLEVMMKTRNMAPMQVIELLNASPTIFCTQKAVDEFNKRQEIFFEKFKLDKKYVVKPILH